MLLDRDRPLLARLNRPRSIFLVTSSLLLCVGLGLVVRLPADKDMIRFNVRTTLTQRTDPVSLTIEGRATIGEEEVAHDAVPAEDRMQAFLWRHLVPAQELPALVYDPAFLDLARRIREAIRE